MIDYKQVELKVPSSEPDILVKALNEYGKDDWQLVSPLVRRGNVMLCIMSKRRMGRPPKDENDES